MLRRERHAQRWPSNEGSNASSTYNELWRVENSFLRMRRHSAAQRGASSPTMSSGERGTHSSEWEGTPPLRRERHAHRWPSGWGEQCWLYQQRALGSGTLIPRNEWTFRRSEGSGILIGNAGSTYNELWRAENSFLRMRRNSDAQQGAACS